jgi:DNA mismatch repair protein MutS2
LLNHLLERGITTLVTTHHPELKAYAHATPGVVNASVEFDLETLRPTFHLTIGLPGRSNALAIAQRLGMPDEIIASARAELNPTDLRADDLLDEIHRQREQSQQARLAAEKARQQVEAQRLELIQRLEKIEDERHAILEKARQESEAQYRELQEEMREVRRQLARARQPVEALETIETRIEILQEAVETPAVRRSPEVPGQVIPRAIRLGDKVHLRTLNTQGVVISLGEEEAEVQVGMMRVRARLADLSASAPANPALEKKIETAGKRRLPAASPARDIAMPVSPGIELDLRGQRADDALDALERYLDSAYLAGLPFVRIIHGKGTGRLRDAIRQALGSHPQVRSFESGGEKEGGEGVTVVKLKV